MVPDEMRKVVPTKPRKVELRQLAVLAGVVIRELVRAADVRGELVRGEMIRGPRLALAGRLGIAAHCVLPCVVCLGESDNISDYARWPELDDGVHGNQMDNVNRGDVDCTGR